ncbi:hypothetical protein [Ktedonospora formicarum]|uniref:Uncharacterized protein n=1 Tax=Ktedonospora formicarum TaxID=2778364 RepID=A0A8J3HW59_9CHLR|nr:hypothetical protein [Ktedonospora formicarum]GHO45197.1 hypothetical protein KSX_33600 [Ktedonospora formicarum]
MALTVRQNGTGPSNLISADWFNDFYKLFTGQMADQPITFKPNVTLRAISAAPSAPTLTASSGTGLGIGVYKYAVTFISADGGETLPSTTASITTTSGNQSAFLTPPIGPAGATGRNIYRTKVGGTALFRVAQLNDNTSTTYTDTLADASVGPAAPTHPSFGGALKFQDANGNTNLTIYSDGSLVSAGGTTNLSGLLVTDGLLGKSTPGDIIDMGGTNTLYIKGPGAITFQPNAGNSVAGINGNGLWIGGVSLGDSGGNLLVPGISSGSPSNGFTFGRNSGSTTSFINHINSGGGFGFKINGSAKAQILNNGNFVIAGNTYYTAQSTIFYTAGGAFAGLDFSEVYQVDQEYAIGTVVCPQDVATPIAYDGTPQSGLPLMSQCTHEKCALAGVIVLVPGYCAGMPNYPGMGDDYDSSKPLKQAIAQVGRIFANATGTISGRQYVTSNGDGTVRAMESGESGMSLGIALSPTVSGLVPILVRPTFVTV